MIEVPLSVEDVSRTRFAYSPLADTAESLQLLFSGRVHSLHQPWLPAARDALRHCDAALLEAVIPARPRMADFLFTGAASRSTTIEEQLEGLARLPADEALAELQRVWAGAEVPDVVRRALVDGHGGMRRVAEALYDFWRGAIEPHWPRMRQVLDADLAHRASELATGGVGGLLDGLHARVTFTDGVLRVASAVTLRRSTAEDGLLLIPSIFTWPHLVASIETTGPLQLVYGARGVARLWEQSPAADGSPLGALLGRNRAAVLGRLDVPTSTTQLARALQQSPAAVSEHLTVLRGAALITSWRSGRSVLHQRTPLAASLLRAAHGSAARPGA